MAVLEAPTPSLAGTHDGPFVNEPMLDFSRDDIARKMRAAIEKVRGQLGREYDLIIGGQRVKTAEKIKSINPAKPSQLVGLHQKAGKEHVEPAMKAALHAFESWSRTSLEERAALVFRVGDLLRERKFELHGVAGLRGQQELGRGGRRHLRDHRLLRVLCPRGAAPGQGGDPGTATRRARPAVLHPARRGRGDSAVEFPLAIMAGMTLASIVCGNTVILKPSSDSPDHRRQVLRTARGSGHARGRGEFLPRLGRDLWRQHRGSSQDTVRRLHRLARSRPSTSTKSQPIRHPARSGSSAPSSKWAARMRSSSTPTPIIDAAVEGVAAAAFGFQGQKCSACSRAIVDERVYDSFLEKLKARVEKIKIGDPAENANMAAGDQRGFDENHPRLHRTGQEGWARPDRRRACRQPKGTSSSRP